MAIEPGACTQPSRVIYTISSTAQSHHLILGKGIERIEEQCPYRPRAFTLPRSGFLEECRKDRQQKAFGFTRASASGHYQMPPLCQYGF
jgi:hypothetical protein